MNYYQLQPTRSRAGVKYSKLVKADQSQPLQKSANGVYFKTVLAPDGNKYAVVIHKKGVLTPFRNEERLPKAVRRHRIKVA